MLGKRHGMHTTLPGTRSLCSTLLFRALCDGLFCFALYGHICVLLCLHCFVVCVLELVPCFVVYILGFGPLVFWWSFLLVSMLL